MRLEGLPVQEGTSPKWSREASQVLQRAAGMAKKDGGDCVSTDRLFQSLLAEGDSKSQLLKDAGVQSSELNEANATMRKGAKCAECLKQSHLSQDH